MQSLNYDVLNARLAVLMRRMLSNGFTVDRQPWYVTLNQNGKRTKGKGYLLMRIDARVYN